MQGHPVPSKLDPEDRGTVFFEALGVPVHCNVLCPDRQAALDVPRGDIRLAFFPESGLVFNVAFDPGLMEYTQEYENSLHHSPRFQEWAEGLVERLVRDWGLYQRDVVEIGCGKGEFLGMLCRAGNNRGVGFDPSYEPGQDGPQLPESVRFVNEFYGEQHTGVPADFICCRHVLEHIEEPLAFLERVRRAIGERTGCAVYFEVPDALWTLRELGVWDIIYEHCAYYTAPSLARAFERAGFVPRRLESGFGGQFLGIEAVPAGGAVEPADRSGEIGDVARLVEAFGERYRRKVREWEDELEELRRSGRRVAAWGAGSKGVTFLNTVRSGDTVERIVDLNPKKQGRFVPGGGQEIVAPERLRESPPDVVILMNPNYRAEVEGTLRELGLSTEVRAV